MPQGINRLAVRSYYSHPSILPFCKFNPWKRKVIRKSHMIRFPLILLILYKMRLWVLGISVCNKNAFQTELV